MKTGKANKINVKLFIGLVVWMATLTTSTVFAQRYPVTTSISLIPPYPISLEKYAEAGSDRLIVSVAFNDFSQSSWNVKLRLTIESGSIRLQTNPEIVVNALSLTPGVPEQLTGFDMTEYFNYNNMVLTGITHEELVKNGGLPDGNYSFALEALDYRTGIVISNKAIANAWLIQNDPPQVTFPQCGERIAFIDPQTIPFQWLPMHISSPNSSFTTEYEFTLVEIPEGINANEAILSGMPILSTTLSTTSFLYGATEPLLENGKSYAYRIRATDSDNLSLFKNEGYSQVCWFTYGYPVNGSIVTTRPKNNALINVNTQPVFSWNAPTNIVAGQPVSYELKIVEGTEGTDASSAIANSTTPFFEETIPEATNSPGFSKKIIEELEPEKNYVWQVKAFTAGIEVASTEGLSFRTTPVIQEFKAGQHIIRIASITNQDLENFSGKGRIKVLEDGTEMDVNFYGLKIISAAGKLMMNDGEILLDLPETFEDIELTPTDPLNGSAYFRPTVIRITKNGMTISGRAEWALPFPLVSGQQAWVKSEVSAVNFDNLKLNGYVKLNDSNVFSLLDPFGFELKLTAITSNFFLRENQYTQNFDGEITLPVSIKSPEGTRVKTSFGQVQQLFYQETTGLDKPIRPLTNVGVHVKPTKLIVDFSGLKSAADISADWKGIYFSETDVLYLAELDKSQLKLDEVLTHHFSSPADYTFRAWADGGGLNLTLNKFFVSAEKNNAKFNAFSGRLSSIKLSLQNNEVKEGEITGSIMIPLLKENYFNFILPLTNQGFEEGYLSEELAGKSYTMNEGREDEMQFVIRQAVFAEYEQLDIILDMSWPELKVVMENVDHFKVWGNGFIGFGSYFGKGNLSNRPKGELKGYPLVLTKVGAGYHEGNYFFNADAEISISSDLSGLNGPTTISLYAVHPVSDNVQTLMLANTKEEMPENDGTSSPVQYNLKLVGSDTKQNGDMRVDSAFVKMDVFLGSLEGYVKFTENDPDWGNSWQGSFNYNMNIPEQMQLAATYIAGRAPEGFDYWFVDVSSYSIQTDRNKDSKLITADKAGPNTSRTKNFDDKTGKGAGMEVHMGPLMISGLEMRLYKHMRHTKPEQVVEGGYGMDITFEPDASVVMGGMGRMGLLDGATGGDILKLDVAIEMTQLSTGKFIYGFEGAIDTESEAYALSGTGKFTYNEEEKHFIGDFWVVFEAKDKLCMEAGLGFDMSPEYWKLSVGTPERRIVVIPKCAGWAPTGYFIIDPNEFELGLGLGIQGKVESKEFKILDAKFKARADFGFAAGLTAGVQYKPYFAIQKAGVWVEAWASASVDYETLIANGTWTFASIKLAGAMTVYFEDSTYIEGTVNGEVYVIGIGCEFEMEFKHTFS